MRGIKLHEYAIVLVLVLRLHLLEALDFLGISDELCIRSFEISNPF